MIALKNRALEWLISTHHRNVALREVLALVNDGSLTVSVVTPTRNRASYLHHTLQSLERQSFPSAAWELIVLDRESQDDTHDLIKQFMRRKSLHIRYQRCSRSQTIGSFMNEGIQLSSSKIIVLLAESHIVSEDFLLNHLLSHTLEERLVSWLNSYAVYTHLFYPSGDHLEGVQPLSILPPRKMQIRRLKHMVVEEQRNAARVHEIGLSQEDQEHLTLFDSSNASFPRSLFDRVCFDDHFLTKEITDFDFASRVVSSGGKLVLAEDRSSYRQLTPTIRHDSLDLEVDISRLRRKLNLAPQGSSHYKNERIATSA